MAQKKKTANFSWEILDALVQFKVSCRFCAEYIGCSEDTIERRIKAKYKMNFSEYKELRSQGIALKLQQKAIKMALEGNNTTMLIFCLKNIANWSDKNEVIETDKEIKVVVQNNADKS